MSASLAGADGRADDRAYDRADATDFQAREPTAPM